MYSARSMSNLYTVLPGLTPTQQEIAEAELLAIQILQAKYPDLDLREGTGLRDTVIRPSAVILALMRKSSDLYFSQNTVSSIDNQTDHTIVDSLMSNWFLTRNTGSRSIISARLYFSRAKNTSITSHTFFSPDNNLRFFPIETATFSRDAMQYDSYSNEYYLDVDMIAESEGAEYNIGEGSLLYFSLFDPYFLRAEINFLKETAIETESNDQFVSRASSAISTRNLINNPSVDSNLRIAFNYLKRIVTIGMGDEEMIRDKIKALFEEVNFRFPSNFTFLPNGDIRVTLPDHMFYTGQTVQFKEATPMSHNGEFVVRSVDKDNFVFTPKTTDFIYDFPHIAPFNKPVYLNYGGKMDIYCGESLANTVVQVMTDGTGRVQIDGPVYSAKRSRVSGGIEDDEIPYIEQIPYQSISVDRITGRAFVTAVNHGLPNDVQIIAERMEQTMPILAISSVGSLVTVTLRPGYSTESIGGQVRVEGVLPSVYNGLYTINKLTNTTFSYNAAFAPGQIGSGSNMRISNPDLDGEYPVIHLYSASSLPGIIVDDASANIETGVVTITPGKDPVPSGSEGNTGYLDSDSFSFRIPSLWKVGDINNSQTILGYVIDPDLRNKYLTYRYAQSIVCTGQNVVVTLPDHGLVQKNFIRIQGSLRREYNGVWQIEQIINQDQFSFTSPIPISEPSVGPAQIQHVSHKDDFGHSQKGAMIGDFGPRYAFKTVSFEVNYFQYLDSVQEYLDDTQNRVLCADLLARGFNLHVLDVSLVAYNGPAPYSGDVAASLNRYLSSLEPGEVFVLADATGHLKEDGITSFRTPLGVTYKRYTRELFKLSGGVITDYLDPEDRTNIFVLGNVTTSNEYL